AAGQTLTVVRLDGHRAGVPGFEGPAPVCAALRRDQLDRIGHSLVGRNAGAAQVIEAPQQVVVPPCRESKADPRGTALAVLLNHLAGQKPPGQAALEKILLPAETGGRDVPASAA